MTPWRSSIPHVHQPAGEQGFGGLTSFIGNRSSVWSISMFWRCFLCVCTETPGSSAIYSMLSAQQVQVEYARGV